MEQVKPCINSTFCKDRCLHQIHKSNQINNSHQVEDQTHAKKEVFYLKTKCAIYDIKSLFDALQGKLYTSIVHKILSSKFNYISLTIKYELNKLKWQ